jgi:hypothetical protein
MGKATIHTDQLIILIGSLIVAVFVLAIFISGITETIYGACWEKARTGFVNLKDGANQISLGDCVDKVYIVPREQLIPLSQSSEKVDIFKCSHRDDGKYLSFAIIKPNTNVGIIGAVTDPVGAVRKKFTDVYCAEYAYNFNNIGQKQVLAGKKNYCLTMESVRGGNANVDKYLNIREGGC